MPAGFSFTPIKGNSYGHYEAPPVPIARVTSPDKLNGAVLFANENGGRPDLELPPQAQFSMLPPTQPDVREVLVICAASGGGKSWIARTYAEEYMAQWPGRKVYVISALTKDKTLDSLPGLKRVNVDSLVEHPFEKGEELKDFKKSLVLFDDCEALTGAAKRVVQELQDALLTLGRHSVTSVIICNHLPARGKETRLMLSEATRYCVFPAAMGYHTLHYLLTTHVGLSPKEVQDLRSIRSRWVVLSKSFPRYLLSSNEARML